MLNKINFLSPPGDDPEVAASLADEDVGVVRREEVVEAGAV